MGLKHKARRQAKARRHHRGPFQRSAGPPRGVGPHPLRPLSAEQVDQLIVDAIHAPCEDRDVAPAVELLVGPEVADGGAHRGLVADRLTSALTVNATLTLHRGWEPLDLSKALRRLANATAAAFVEGVLAEAVRRRRPPQWAERRWEGQLADLAGGSKRLRSGAPSWRDDVPNALRALHVLVHVPPLPDLAPSAGSAAPRPGLDPAVLEKVRALLAKAEATDFEEEAEAFLAKAQELMSRHNLDKAAVEAGGDNSAVGALRCWLDDPYRKEKAYLAHVVATANRCRAIADHELGMSTVFGHPDDLASFEVLFTALLVHASKHMRLPLRDPASLAAQRSKRPSYRRSFLIAYADRIGHRLSEASQAATEAAVADSGGSLLPVLASRKEQVDGTVHKVFPKLAPTRFSVTDYDGWAAGRAAADLADLSVRPTLTGTG